MKDKKIKIILSTILALVLTVIGSLLCFSITWMFQTWSNLSMDELMYHLSAPLEGTNQGMIVDYLDNCLAGTILLFFTLSVLLIQFRKKRVVYYRIIRCTSVVAVLTTVMFICGAWSELGVSDYASNQGTYSEFFDTYYTDPRDVTIAFPEQKRNLIYIYLESMEVTYADKEDGGTFDEGCIPELTKLAQENEDFSGTDDTSLNGGYAMPGTTWTVAAMFSQSTGIPLNISIDDNSMSTQDSFFPDAVALGDILEQAGYHQALLIGSDATFGGRRLLYTDHGNFDIEDYDYAKDNEWIPEDHYVWWGYEDELLINNAKQQLLELSSQAEPFNLTMLTVDTHFEDGYVCNRCSDKYGENQYANVMACSSRQISNFIKWIQRQSFYDNTTIVIVGDHPTMDSDFCEDVQDEYTRKVYTTYINSAVETENTARRDYTTFDNFPTTLASLGVQIKGNRLGLGTNLFGTEPTLTERFGIDEVSGELKKKSKKLEELASIDANKENLITQEETISNPMAVVSTGEYDFESGDLPVYITDIQDGGLDMQSVLISVWHDEDQNDLTWIQAERTEDGSYIGNIHVPNFDYKTGEYYIEAYVIDSDGTRYQIGMTSGTVY